MKSTKENKPTVRTAAAITYDAEKNRAPEVSAAGRGTVAERIIEIARENGIPIKYDPDLVQILSKIKVGSEIPVELYRAVAEILAYVYSLNENRRTDDIR